MCAMRCFEETSHREAMIHPEGMGRFGTNRYDSPEGGSESQSRKVPRNEELFADAEGNRLTSQPVGRRPNFLLPKFFFCILFFFQRKKVWHPEGVLDFWNKSPAPTCWCFLFWGPVYGAFIFPK